MHPLNPAIQIALKNLLDDYGTGKRRFEYDQYSQFSKRTFYHAMYALKNKTDSHLIRKSKPYYIHSDLVYELVDADTVGKRIIMPAKSPQSHQNLTQPEPC